MKKNLVILFFVSFVICIAFGYVVGLASASSSVSSLFSEIDPVFVEWLKSFSSVLVSYVGNWSSDKINYYTISDIYSIIINNQSYFSTFNYTYANKSDYQFDSNNFNGSGNFTSLGYVNLGSKVVIGTYLGSSNYGSIGLAGVVSSTDYNFVSSPLDKSLYINRPSNQNIYFRENNDNSAGLVMIKAGGNMGVGTLNPVAKFDVNGSIGIRANVTSQICNSTTEGFIYYDGSTKKHYGCNSTVWNQLY